MAETALQAAGNWTAQQLYRVVNDAAEKAKREAAAMRANTSRIAELRRRAEQIPVPSARAKALEAVGQLSRKQAQLILDYRAFTTRWKDVMAKVGAWLRSVGITPPAFGLGAVGVLQVVPLAIAAGVAAVVGFVAIMAQRNAGIAHALAALDSCRNAYLDGKLTEEQYRQCAHDVERTLEAASRAAPKGPVGDLADVLKQLLPIGLVIVAILVLPQLVGKRPEGLGPPPPGGKAQW